MTPIDWQQQSIDDVVHEVNQRLKADGIEFGEYEFSNMTRLTSAHEAPMPNCRWLLCYPVRGGSEGWYIHLAAVTDGPDSRRGHQLLGLAKTWTEQDAWEIAQAAARLLDIV